MLVGADGSAEPDVPVTGKPFVSIGVDGPGVRFRLKVLVKTALIPFLPLVTKWTQMLTASSLGAGGVIDGSVCGTVVTGGTVTGGT